MGCFASMVILITTLICVGMVIGIKFVMALSFSWFLSYRLTEKPRTILKPKKDGKKGDEEANANGLDMARNTKVGRKNLYTVMLVTCYSEGENSIRTTMNSLANTSYSTKHKLMMVICDGIVIGQGNKMSTPDIVVNMLDISPGCENPKPCSYLAIADGEKQHNMAKVLILMSFFQRVLFADRFTELDFELFNKIHRLMNVWPDQFELCLMVDADTMVKGDSLSYMVTAMQNNQTIMGLCGETKIANKTASWVSAIQVFEYYISHHLGKAFESVFGGVTCLPGCFCMYRIKAPKYDAWVPILANPEVIQEYNQNIVSTLHQKNLLLLGEDRYLTTLMLRTFPKRQMVFVPQAQCKTVVPDTFSVLLSQRRRWINSTIHNLLELVLVTDLCGIAFLSMQFVVLLELIGTVVLPAAILMTIGMIIVAIANGHFSVLPLVMIITIVGLPAVLIVLTTRKWIYVLYMLIYVLSIPIWNFVLPLYSFWHFDDFSWGETRKVANQKRKSGQDHGDAEGVFESGSIIMRKWEEWEKERLKAMGYRIQKRYSADRGINDLPPPAASIPSGTPDSLKSPSKKLQKTGSASNARSIVPSASAAASTPSLGSTLGGGRGNGSVRANGASGMSQRQVSNHAMPASTPNLISRPQRPRPPPNTMPRPPPPGSMGPGPRGDGQVFEMGPMGSLHSRPVMSSSGPSMNGSRPPPNSGPGGPIGLEGPGRLEARHSIHGEPGIRPMGPPRPMMRPPMMGGGGGPPGNQLSRQMTYHSQGFPGGPPGRPRPPQQSFSGPVLVNHQVSAPPTHMYPNIQQPPPQQQQQGSGGVPYPRPPPPAASSPQQLLPPQQQNQTQLMADQGRQSRLSDISGQTAVSSNRRSAASQGSGTALTGGDN
ncbi:hypothetical protein BGZ80_004802 [Entomortierella chlamydospora]|uniref:chitin synthase n=1 Tax=Entomortierella chlamydospora TaxID=101097 RepID=A0A9P6SVQ0_9FUNG|nr:hypothetical protein BGZ80_004802 [Entomortierella chlamydospora]